VDGSLTGYENLLIFSKLYDISRKQREQRIYDAPAFMGLSEAADKLVRDYSGGMITRLSSHGRRRDEAPSAARPGAGESLALQSADER
jgi:hypothetical protein